MNLSNNPLITHTCNARFPVQCATRSGYTGHVDLIQQKAERPKKIRVFSAQEPACRMQIALSLHYVTCKTRNPRLLYNYKKGYGCRIDSTGQTRCQSTNPSSRTRLPGLALGRCSQGYCCPTTHTHCTQLGRCSQGYCCPTTHMHCTQGRRNCGNQLDCGDRHGHY